MKYLMILIMTCSLYSQSIYVEDGKIVGDDSTTIVYWNNIITTTYNVKDNPDNLWYNYATGNIDYRASFTDEVAGWLILQTPKYLKVYKWLRAKGYNPMESVRRTNAFADKEHKEFEREINKIMEK